MDLRILRSPIPRSYFWWLVFICVMIITQKICKNSKIGVLQLCHMYMIPESFYKGQTNFLCIGAHKRIRIQYCLRNGIPLLTKFGTNIVHNLSTGTHKRFRIHLWLQLETA